MIDTVLVTARYEKISGRPVEIVHKRSTDQ